MSEDTSFSITCQRTGTKRLIVLVSGWSGSKSDFYWRPFRNKWKDAGYDVIQAGFPYRGFAHIRQSANAVEKALESVRSDYEHITFVGHSMGGLVGRYLVQRKKRADLIDTYVSLGTPHKGSVLAGLAPWSPSASQMRVGSSFLRRLASEPWPEEIPALALQGQLEEVVLPQSNARFDAAQNVVIPWANHVGLIFLPRTFHEIWSWLTYEIHQELGHTSRLGSSSSLHQ